MERGRTTGNLKMKLKYPSQGLQSAFYRRAIVKRKCMCVCRCDFDRELELEF